MSPRSRSTSSNRPPQAVEQKLEAWNPAQHKELEVWLHENLPLISLDDQHDFAALSTLPDNKSVNNMVKAVYGYTANSDSVQLNPAEQALVAAHGDDQSETIHRRSVEQNFAGPRGFLPEKNQLGEAKYVANTGTILPFAEAKGPAPQRSQGLRRVPSLLKNHARLQRLGNEAHRISITSASISRVKPASALARFI